MASEPEYQYSDEYGKQQQHNRKRTGIAASLEFQKTSAVNLVYNGGCLVQRSACSHNIDLFKHGKTIYDSRYKKENVVGLSMGQVM